MHTLNVRDVLREAGVESEIYAASVAPSAALAGARAVESFVGGPHTAMLYQLSTGSRLAGYVRDRPEALIVNYHNISPGGPMWPWDGRVALELEGGRQQVRALARRSQLAVAMSDYSAHELRDANYARTAVVPPLIDVAARAGGDDRDRTGRLRELKAEGGTDWLFVSRIAPHKSPEDVVKAFAIYRRCCDGRARLWLVGDCHLPRYLSALIQYVDQLGLSEAVTFTGALPDEHVASHYAAADVLVSLSRHEGFGLPL